MGKTNFLTLDKMIKTEQKTVFKKMVGADFEMEKIECLTPDDYDNVLYLGYDEDYGDVFKCWNHESDFAIIFGEKGNEFE